MSTNNGSTPTTPTLPAAGLPTVALPARRGRRHSAPPAAVPPVAPAPVPSPVPADPMAQYLPLLTPISLAIGQIGFPTSLVDAVKAAKAGGVPEQTIIEYAYAACGDPKSTDATVGYRRQSVSYALIKSGIRQRAKRADAGKAKAEKPATLPATTPATPPTNGTPTPQPLPGDPVVALVGDSDVTVLGLAMGLRARYGLEKARTMAQALLVNLVTAK